MSELQHEAECLQEKILNEMSEHDEDAPSAQALNRAWHGMGDVIMELSQIEELESQNG